MRITWMQRELISGFASAATLMAAVLATNLMYPICVGVAALVYIGARLSIPTIKDPDHIQIEDGLSQATLDRIVADGIETARSIASRASSIRNPDVRQTVAEIADIVLKIHENFRDDPSDVRRASKFLNHHLPKAVQLIETYGRLQSIRRLDAEERTCLETAGRTILHIREGFLAQLNDLLLNDFDKLETGGATLTTMLDMDTTVESRQFKRPARP